MQKSRLLSHKLLLVLCFSALASGSVFAQEAPAAAPLAIQSAAPLIPSSSSKAESRDTLKLLSQMLSIESDGLVTDSETLMKRVAELLKQLDLSAIEQDGLKQSLTDLTSWSDSMQEMNSRTLEQIQDYLADALAARARADRQRDAWRSTTLIASGAAVGLAIAGPIGAAIGAALGVAITIAVAAKK